ncbi:MAG: B12-binding domain-containing radical SAM protein [Chromatiales bacterium]|nr:MAG: B12-binding domain-containing radical SAM protein [Chromatiales bacterium]
MKIVFISPAGPLYRYRGGIFRKSLRYSPLTLVTLAAYIPDELDAEVQIVDEGIEAAPSRPDADLIAMTVITGSAKRAYELAARYRAQGIPVVMGGPHVTLIPEDAAPHADCIVTGYAEHTWPQLLRDFAAGNMQPRYDQGQLDLSGLPLPRRDLLAAKKYSTTSVFEATRGCAHNCEFCVVPAAWGRRPYQKPVADVVRDIRSTGTRKALFIDLNLIADRGYARRLFEALVPLDIRWFGLATVLLEHDRDLLELMARSGCRGLLVGLESVNQDSLDVSCKRFNQTINFHEFVRLLHRHRIALMGTFVFGLDSDTPKVFEETARFAIDAAIDLPRFAIATPFPGTALYQRLHQEGRILTRDWDIYDGQHVVFQPSQMSVQELAAGHEWTWKHVYSRRSIFRRLARSRLQLPISIAANLGYRFYAHHLHTHYNCDWFVGQEVSTPAR